MGEGAQDWIVARLDDADVFWSNGTFFAAGAEVSLERIREWDRAGRLKWLATDERPFLLQGGIPSAGLSPRRETVWHLLLVLGIAVAGNTSLALMSPYVIDGTPYASAATTLLWLGPLAVLWYALVAYLCSSTSDAILNGTKFFCFFSPFIASLTTMLFTSTFKAGPDGYAYLVASGQIEARRAALLPVSTALWVLAFGIAAVAQPWLSGDPLVSPVTEAETRRRTATLWLLAACGALALFGYLTLAVLGRLPA